jgi:hypothetical protein
MLPPFEPKEKFKCPRCGEELSYWNFQGQSLDYLIYNKENDQRAVWEVKIDCFRCEKPIFGYVWMYDVSSESKFEKERQGL